MPIVVEVPNRGKIEFPDGTPDTEIDSIVSQEFPATGQDIAEQLQDPNFTPTVDQFKLFEEYNKTKQTDWLQTILSAADSITQTAGAAAKQALTTDAALNVKNYVEGLAQGTAQLYGLVAQSQNPDSALFKLNNLISGTGSVESRYDQFIAARQFNKDLDAYAKGDMTIMFSPEQLNPEFVQGVAMVADPTMFLPGIGQALGVEKVGAKAVGKAAQIAGRGVQAVARPVQAAASAAERAITGITGVSPEALRGGLATSGVLAATGMAPAVGLVGAVPLVASGAMDVGRAIETAGARLGQAPTRIGALEAVGAIPEANMRQRLIGTIGRYGGDAALNAALVGTTGSLEGAAVGGALGYLSGGEEGAAAGIGSGAAAGALGSLGARGIQTLTGQQAKAARLNDLTTYIDSLPENKKAAYQSVRERFGTDTASNLMDLETLIRGTRSDIGIELLTGKEFEKQAGVTARGIVPLENAPTPRILINVDAFSKGKGDTPIYTLGHELVHALASTKQFQGDITALTERLTGAYIPNPDGTMRLTAEGQYTPAKVEELFNQFVAKLPDDAKAQTINDNPTAADRAAYVGEELAAEQVGRILSAQKPDAFLRGFGTTRQSFTDMLMLQDASRAASRIGQYLERTFGVTPSDSIVFPQIKESSPMIDAALRQLLRARTNIDEALQRADFQKSFAVNAKNISDPTVAEYAIRGGFAERNQDGTVRLLTNGELLERERKDVSAARSIVNQVAGAKMDINGSLDAPLSPEQVNALNSSSVSSQMKERISMVNDSIKMGRSVLNEYYPATERKQDPESKRWRSKYAGRRMTFRETLFYNLLFSKEGNAYARGIDLSKIRSSLQKHIKDGGVAGVWPNVTAFMSDLAAYLTNRERGENAIPTRQLLGPEKAEFMGSFLNSFEQGGSEFIHAFRLDRFGKMDPGDFRARFGEVGYKGMKNRLMPAGTVGDAEAYKSQSGYTVLAKNNKFRLYGSDGKLIGIYDSSQQAEKKIYATEARIQPQDRQLQYQARDEGGQTAEAGGRNRVERGTEGEGQVAPVRQEGDVGTRFMPSGKSDGLSVLDDELRLDLPPRPKVLDIANAFQKLFGKSIDYKKSNPQDNARLVSLLVQEIQRAVDLHPEAKGWYDENVKLMMDVMRELDPEIANPQNDFIFKTILAATSDGNKVGPQFEQTWKEYSNWKNTGEISGKFVSGDRIENIQTNLEMVNQMVKDVGWEATKDFFTRKGTVKEVRKALMDVFGWTKKEAQGIGSSELSDEVVPFAVVLGPKLGSFFNNLYGDFSSVTMDRWFMRTLGRLTGSQVAPLSGGKIREMRSNLRASLDALTPSQFSLLGIKRGDLKGSGIDSAATTVSGRFSQKSLRDTAKQLAEAGQPALEQVRKYSNALKKGLNPLVEAPIDGTHRRWIRERIAEVQDQLRSKGIDLENADLQAVLWYLEKELYEKLKYRSKSGESDYASAASSLYQSVVGRPSDIYAAGTGRVRAIGSTGRSEVMVAAQESQPSATTSQSLAPAEDIGRRVPFGRFGIDPATRGIDFADAIRRTKAEHQFGFAVDDKGSEFYSSPSTQLFLSEDGLAGVAVTDYGDLVSVFKHPASKADIKPLLAEAAERSQTLDAFDVNGFLPNLYGKFGFRPAARVPFKREFAPTGWRYDLAGEPDVVLMVRDVSGTSGLPDLSSRSYSDVKSSVPSVGYDEAVRIQQEAKAKVAESRQLRLMPDASVPGAFSASGGFRILPGKTGGRLRVYGPSGALVGIVGSQDEAQRLIRRKTKNN
jgi:hypothetical protein